MLQSQSALSGMSCRAWDMCCDVTFQVAPSTISLMQHFPWQSCSSCSQHLQWMLIRVHEHPPASPAPSSQGIKTLSLFHSTLETFLSSARPQKLRQMWGHHIHPFPGPHHGKAIKGSALRLFLPKMGVFQLWSKHWHPPQSSCFRTNCVQKGKSKPALACFPMSSFAEYHVPAFPLCFPLSYLPDPCFY